MFNKKIFLSGFILICFITGCAAPFMKGINANGQKVYLDQADITQTEAYQEYLQSEHTEINKERYIFKRVVGAKDLRYHRDGNTYGWVEAYRAGNWLMRTHYDKEADARSFIRDHVWKSETTGNPHLIQFPSGDIHVAYYVLLNELDLLEDTLAKQS